MQVTENDIIELYETENKSTYEIAEMYNTYPNKIRRILQKHGKATKSRSEAQKNTLKNGRSNHPTLGKKRSYEERVKISAGLSEYWGEMDEQEKERRTKIAKDRWDKMTDEQKARISQLASENIRKAGKEGSKLEKFLLRKLSDGGYKIEFHKKNLIQNEKLEIDLYIPKLQTIIEIDGPSHFLPVWGEERLQKQLNSDLQKNGLILSKGYVIIRVKVLSSVSLKKQEDIYGFILNKLREIEENFPPRSQRYIEVEL